MRPDRFVFPVLLLVSACATVDVGREFDLSAFQSKARSGITTEGDVRAWLGAPAAVGTSVETNGDRYAQWIYYHGEGRFPGVADARLKILQLKFDERGVLRAYNWSGEQAKGW